MTHAQFFSEISKQAPIVPVLVVEDEAHAVPLAQALSDGGALAIEVTLRTQSAIRCIELMKTACPALKVGAGTVLSEGDIDACVKVGADFLVTPGTSLALAEALLDYGIASCPGAGTASEALTLYEMGFDHLKFFPAGASGGVDFLKSLAGPLRNIAFMPTGGVTPANMSSYLGLPNVFAVGGSWLAPPDLVSNGKFEEITRNMKAALNTD